MTLSHRAVVWVVGLLLVACSSLPDSRPDTGAEQAVNRVGPADVLEHRPPLPPRAPPPRAPAVRPGRGGRGRGPRNTEPVFNAEPTPEQRESARRQTQAAALLRAQQERYWRLKAEAEKSYPEKVGRYEAHHLWPLYMGGPPNGATYRIPAPYHQLLTNAFRHKWPYGQDRPNEQKARQILLEVYSEFPIPQLIDIPNP